MGTEIGFDVSQAAARFTATIPMPFHGESVVEGVLVAWHVGPGDQVSRGQPLADIETEKSLWTFESPCEGRIVSLAARESDAVAVAAPLLAIETSDPNVRHLEGAPAEREPAQQRPEAASAPVTPAVPEPRGEPAGLAAEGPAAETRLSPRVKGMLRRGLLDIGRLQELRKKLGRSYLTGRQVEGSLEPESRTECRIAGLGVAVPERVVPNSAFLDAFPDLNEAYIEQVTGIAERRYLSGGEATSDIALRASRAALERAGVEPAELDMIILATTTPDMPVPATACALEQKLGLTGVPAFDLSAACSGWLYALCVGRQFLRGGAYRKVLVVAAEAMSRFTNPSDRATAFLFGDGAGAAVLSSSGRGPLLSEVLLSSEPEGYDIISRRAGGSLLPWEAVHNGDSCWRMDGKRMYQGAVRLFSDTIRHVLDREELAIDDVRWIVPHQANERMWKAVAQRTGIPASRFFSNIRRYGNTSAATIPLALRDLEVSGGLESGDRVVLCAVGAGLTSAGCLLTWG